MMSDDQDILMSPTGFLAKSLSGFIQASTSKSLRLSHLPERSCVVGERLHRWKLPGPPMFGPCCGSAWCRHLTTSIGLGGLFIHRFLKLYSNPSLYASRFDCAVKSVFQTAVSAVRGKRRHLDERTA